MFSRALFRRRAVAQHRIKSRTPMHSRRTLFLGAAVTVNLCCTAVAQAPPDPTHVPFTLPADIHGKVRMEEKTAPRCLASTGVDESGNSVSAKKPVP